MGHSVMGHSVMGHSVMGHSVMGHSVMDVSRGEQLADLAQTGEALTAVTGAALEATLAVAVAQVEQGRGTPLPTRFAVIAMGRYGGHRDRLRQRRRRGLRARPAPGPGPGGRP